MVCANHLLVVTGMNGGCLVGLWINLIISNELPHWNKNFAKLDTFQAPTQIAVGILWVGRGNFYFSIGSTKKFKTSTLVVNLMLHLCVKGIFLICLSLRGIEFYLEPV